MLNLVLALFFLSGCLLLAGIVAFHVEITGRKVGGLYHWRVLLNHRPIVGGSFYRPSRAYVARHGHN